MSKKLPYVVSQVPPSKVEYFEPRVKKGESILLPYARFSVYSRLGKCRKLQRSKDYVQFIQSKTYRKSYRGRRMTNEKTIEILKAEYLGDSENMKIAKRIAISALEK